MVNEMVIHPRNKVKFMMKIIFDNSDYYNKNLVELFYIDSKGNKQKNTINKGDEFVFNEEKNKF